MPQVQPLADAVRHGLLRDRADGRRRQPVRHRPLRRRGHAVQPPAVRPDDRRRPGGDEDDAGPPADLAPDARAEVVHQHGGLRLHRRGLRHLRGGPGRRPLHPGRRLHPRLPAPARADPPGADGPPGQDPARRLARRAPACPSWPSASRCWPRSGRCPPASPSPASGATRTASATACPAAPPLLGADETK